MVLIKGSSWILIQLPFLVHAYYKIKLHKAGTNNVKREKPSSGVEEEVQVRPTSPKIGRQERFDPFFAPNVAQSGTSGAPGQRERYTDGGEMPGQAGHDGDPSPALRMTSGGD